MLTKFKRGKVATSNLYERLLSPLHHQSPKSFLFEESSLEGSPPMPGGGKRTKQQQAKSTRDAARYDAKKDAILLQQRQYRKRKRELPLSKSQSEACDRRKQQQRLNYVRRKKKKNQVRRRADVTLRHQPSRHAKAQSPETLSTQREKKFNLTTTTHMIHAGHYHISKQIQRELGAAFRSFKLKNIPSKKELFALVDTAFKHFQMQSRSLPQGTLRLRGGAPGGGGGGGGGGNGGARRSCEDARTQAASIGTSVMSGKSAPVQKKAQFAREKQIKGKKASTASKISLNTTQPFILKCMQKKEVRDAIKIGGTLHTVARQLNEQVRAMDPAMYDWNMQTVRPEYRLWEDMVFTGGSIVGDGRPVGFCGFHVDKEEDCIGAIATFGDTRKMRGGSTIFWRRGDKEEASVHLALEHENGRATVGRFDRVHHAGTPWHDPRFVVTLYTKTPIVDFFEHNKLDKNHANHSTLFHTFTPRTEDEYNKFMANKPAGTTSFR